MSTNCASDRIILAVFLVIAILLPSTLIAQESAPVIPANAAAVKTIWFEDWDEGIAVSLAAKKPIVLDVVSDGCSWCVKMEKETFAAPEIDSLLSERFVCIRINVSRRERFGTYDHKKMSYPELGRFFGVSAYPTIVFLDREAQPLMKIRGFHDAPSFRPYLENPDISGIPAGN